MKLREVVLVRGTVEKRPYWRVKDVVDRVFFCNTALREYWVIGNAKELTLELHDKPVRESYVLRIELATTNVFFDGELLNLQKHQRLCIRKTVFRSRDFFAADREGGRDYWVRALV